jgi:hypothetical protein
MRTHRVPISGTFPDFKELWFSDTRSGPRPCQDELRRDRFEEDARLRRGNRRCNSHAESHLLVAFSRLTSAATAHAECAWVLWTERGTGSWPEGTGLCECSVAYVEPGLSMLKPS